MNQNNLLKNSNPTILYGAGQVGKIALYSLLKKNIKVDYFFDSDERKFGKDFCGIKVLSKEDFLKIADKSKVYISNNYIKPVSDYLKKIGCKNFKDCREVFTDINLEEYKKNFTEYEWKNINRDISFHQNMSKKLKIHLT